MKTPKRPASRSGGEIRFSARLFVFGWLLLTTAIGLVTLVVTVNSTLQAGAAREANRDVAQELEEFRQFAEMGVDPETGRPFESFHRLVEVFLSRQEAGHSEVILGVDAEGRATQRLVGIGVPPPEMHDLRRESELLASAPEQLSGIAETSAGELRWAAVQVRTEAGASGSLVVGDYTQLRYDEATRVTWVVSWVSLGVLLLTGVIGWLVAGRILRPIRRMRRAAARISQADLSRRIPVHGEDELAQLAATFNQMLDRIESAFAHEQRFVDEAARKLRAPVARARAQLDAAADGPHGANPAVDQARTELDRMDAIVADLISLARAERPDFIRIEPRVHIAELTRAIVTEAEQLAPRRWVLGEAAEGRAQLDSERIGQAVLELAENAVHHTAVGDEIRICSRLVEEDGIPSVRFSVADDGPGVLAQDAERIFERFGRSSEDTGGDGAGLGLAIVRAIADGHAGWVSVDSLPGTGSVFAITVPLRAEPVPLDPATSPIRLPAQGRRRAERAVAR